VSKLSRFFRSLGTSSDSVSSFFKLIVTLSIALGAYYLGCYIVLNDVALPVNFAATATLLIALGFTAALIVAVVTFYTLMGLITTSKLFGESLITIACTTRQGVIAPTLLRQIWQLFVVFTLPQLVIYLLMGEQKWTTIDTLFLSFVVLVVPLVYGLSKAHIYIKSVKRSHSGLPASFLGCTCQISFSIIFMNVLAAVSATFLILILDRRGLLPSPSNFWMTAIFFVLISNLALIARMQPGFVDKIVRNDRKGRIIIPERAYRTFGRYVLACFIFVSLAPPLAAEVGRSTLTLLGIGGGVPRIIYAPAEGKGSLPAPLIDKCEASSKSCTSKEVELLLDSGETATVRLHKDKDTELFRLHTEESSMGWSKQQGDAPHRAVSKPTHTHSHA